MTILFDNLSTNSPPELNNIYYEKERSECSKLFEKWPENDQTDFVASEFIDFVSIFNLFKIIIFIFKKKIF